MVAQIDEDHAAVVAAGVGPAAERDGLTDQGLVDQAAVVATHGTAIESWRVGDCTQGA